MMSISWIRPLTQGEVQTPQYRVQEWHDSPGAIEVNPSGFTHYLELMQTHINYSFRIKIEDGDQTFYSPTVGPIKPYCSSE